MLIFVRPALFALASKRREGRAKYTVVMGLLISIFLCSWYTDIIGVHPICNFFYLNSFFLLINQQYFFLVGAFILGVVTPRKNNFAHEIVERIEDLILIVFLPLYFIYSGLQADISKLRTGLDWAIVAIILVLACIGKIFSITIACKILKYTWRESISVGILMNTRGLVGLIVLNIGLQVGILTEEVKNFISFFFLKKKT